MVKQIAILGFLSLAIAFNSNAHDGDRIAKLEKKIQEIELRLSKIESLVSDTSNAKVLVTSSEGWKSVMNWRKLTNDMSASDVKKILGEPHRVDGGDFTQWYYQNRGTITFYEGKVYKWMEPRQ